MKFASEVLDGCFHFVYRTKEHEVLFVMSIQLFGY